ncbi:hypothetical protein N7490_008479 [Penicillium lividum]|nr:hypothetical protein N7490_008479 [Penicillium lividum]
MASLDRLPYELLSSINGYAADWVGLESLLQISPQVRKLFAGDFNNKADPEAIRLVESILEKNTIMSHELHCYFRMTMELRQPSLADKSIAEFMARDYSLSLMTSSSSTTRAILQEMVIVAANIQRLACTCLTTLLTRLRKVQPRRWEVHYTPDSDVPLLTGTTPYESRDAGPPSWIEEYRVYRALWHLQLCSDLLVVADRLGWAQSDLEYLRSHHMDLDQLPGIPADEILSVKECLEDLSSADTDYTTRPSVESNSSDMALIKKLPIATQLSCKFDVWSPPLAPTLSDYDAAGILRDIWGRGTGMTNRNSIGNLWRSWQIRSRTHPAKFQACSLQDSRPWRALGMPFWDRWRFYGLGLWTAQWPVRPASGPILTPDGVEVPNEADPPIIGEDIGYRLSVFIDARVQIERQERMERMEEDKPARD